jgi:hypothetical protein
VTARIVSAEEARGLLEGATPGPWHMEHASKAPPGEEWGEVVARLHPAGGAGAPVPGMRLTWSRRSVGVLAERNARLIAASHSLAHTVIALEGERDAALARVARLERVLAVEAGDKAQAPPDWRPTTGGAWNGKEDNYVYRIAAGRWSWVSRDTRSTVRGRGESPSALEAMEAADAATSTPTPPADSKAPR